jgi:uncharacterized protein YbaR (Trm112 family)
MRRRAIRQTGSRYLRSEKVMEILACPEVNHTEDFTIINNVTMQVPNDQIKCGLLNKGEIEIFDWIPKLMLSFNKSGSS